MRHLILGSGPAGIAAAKAARKMEKDAEVVIVTEEFAAPYLRPNLPDLISGETPPPASLATPSASERESIGT